jgi:hypothetical protein
MVNAFDRVMKSRIAAQVVDIINAAGRQVVKHKDLITSPQTGVGQMRPDKPRTAGDEHTHQETSSQAATEPIAAIEWHSGVEIVVNRLTAIVKVK